MTMNPLPPQAYTKETMLKAYSWLMNQSTSIREMASTPDILVSLYLKATRDGDSALDRPSIQNFKNELKSLAGLMGELDKSPQAHPVATVMPQANPTSAHVSAHNHNMHSSAHSQNLSAHQHQHQQQSANQTASTTNVIVHMPAAPTMPQMQAQPTHHVPPIHSQQTMPQQHHHAHPMGAQAMPHQNMQSHHSSAQTQPTVSNHHSANSFTVDSHFSLDTQTLSMIREVKEDFNLSSDSEALRMMIKIGYTRAKSLAK